MAGQAGAEYRQINKAEVDFLARAIYDGLRQSDRDAFMGDIEDMDQVSDRPDGCTLDLGSLEIGGQVTIDGRFNLRWVACQVLMAQKTGRPV